MTIPPAETAIDDISVRETVKERLAEVIKDDQQYWYDHPIQIGVKKENNEFLYGLHGLEGAICFEKNRSQLDGDTKVTCLLSVSVTHKGLHEITRPYLEDTLAGSEGLDDLDIFVFY